MRAIDHGLDRSARREEPGKTGTIGASLQPSRRLAVPKPGLTQVSASEQSAWLDENLPKLVAAMADSPELRTGIAGPLAATKAPSPTSPKAGGGPAPGELERCSALIQNAVSANPRYGPSAKSRPQPAVTVMKFSHVARVEVTYPAPLASKVLEPGPLTIDAWVCPDRETARRFTGSARAALHSWTRARMKPSSGRSANPDIRRHCPR